MSENYFSYKLIKCVKFSLAEIHKKTFKCIPEDEVSDELNKIFKGPGSDITFFFPLYMKENMNFKKSDKHLSSLKINGIPLLDAIDEAFDKSFCVILTIPIDFFIAPLIQKYLLATSDFDNKNKFRIYRHGKHMILFLFSNSSYKKKLPRFSLYNNKNEMISNIDYETSEQVLLFKYITPNDSVLQLGGNIGTSCILVDKLVKGPNVCVEPNSSLIPLLNRNKTKNKAKFVIIDGIVSKKKGLVLIESDDENKWGSFVSGSGEGKLVKNYDFNELNKKYKFTVLFADCEGCLESFFTEYPNSLTDIKKIIFEQDQEDKCNYTLVIEFIKKNGFRHVAGSFHQVYLHESLI